MSTNALQNKADWSARSIALVSLLVSGLALYFSALRSPDVDVSVAQHLLINKQPRIGILCTFSNEGAKQTVVTFAKLKWDSPAITLDSQMTSTSLEQWEFDDKGRIATIAKTRYTPIVAPIPVRGHDQASIIFWFTSTEDRAFSFTAGEHTLFLTIMSGSNEMAKKRMRIVLRDDVAVALNDPQSSSTVEYPVEVVSQE
jgi:hypothetical protein